MLLAGIYLLATGAWALRWHRLLSLAGADIPFLTAWRLTLQGMAGSVFLPGSIGGDALRVAFALGKGASPVVVVATVLLDRGVGLVTLAAVASVFAFACSGADAGPVAWILASFPVAFGLALLVARSPQVARLKQPTWGWWMRLVRPVFDYITSKGAPRALFQGALASTVLSLVNLLAIRGIVFALGVSPTEERWIYVGAAMAFIIEAIPALPGGWGTADAAFVVFLARAGLPPSTALAVSLLYRMLNYVSALVGAALYVAHGRRHAEERGAREVTRVEVSRASVGASR